MATIKHSTISTPRTLAMQLAQASWQAARTYSKQHWKKILQRSAVVLPVGILSWLFISVDIRINDGQTIAQRAQAFGGLGLTAFFVYSRTPPLQAMADKAALRHGIDPMLFRALIQQESRWNIYAVSEAGAAGLTQLMPDTASSECGLSAEDRFVIEKNLDCGARYLSKQLQRFSSIDLALAAYNAGPEKVAKLGRVPRIAETQNYVAQIMASWNSGGGI